MSKSIGANRHRKPLGYLKFKRVSISFLILSVLTCGFCLDWGQQLSKVSKVFGLSFRVLEVNSISPAKIKEIKLLLDLEKGVPIFSINLEEKKRSIEKTLIWVKSITIKRRLPDTIVVNVTERIPLSRWQYNYKNYLIDEDGVVLSDDTKTCNMRADLPLVVGSGAPEEAKAFLSELNNYPNLAKRVTSSVRVSRRRWDIYIDEKLKIMLPEGKDQAALAKLNNLQKNLSILDLDISIIDMRIAGRYVISGKQAKLLLDRTRAAGKEI